MVSNFSAPIKSQNNGSSKAIIIYLDKENLGKQLEEKEYFFNKNDIFISPFHAIEMIDNNAKNQGLKKEQDRFYCLTINPSQKELEHIKNDPQKLKSYTIEVMDNYAKNFNKDINANSLVWVAKIENERKYTHEDKEVQEGYKKQGELKEGLQTHIHITISRFTKKSNESERTISLSPLTNHKDTNKGVTKGGFNRVDFINANEMTFDERFRYERELNERFSYSKASILEKAEMIQKEKETGLNSLLEPSKKETRDILIEEEKNIVKEDKDLIEAEAKGKTKSKDNGYQMDFGM